LTFSTTYALISQADRNQFVFLDFGPTQEVKVCQSMINNKCHNSQFVIPPMPFSVRLIHCIAEKVIAVDAECNTETQLRNGSFGTDVACIATVTLSSGLRVLTTVDTFGQLLIYGWMGNMITTTEPLARCQVLRDADHICTFAESDHSLILGLVNVYDKVAVYLIDLSYAIEL
jgi:hypothetical protein